MTTLSFLPGWRDKPLVRMTPAEIDRVFDEMALLVRAPTKGIH